MSLSKTEKKLRIKRVIRGKISGTAERPRLSVFKSNTAIYGQLIDDRNGHTLASVSSLELGKTSSITVDQSKTIGKKLAKKALANGISDAIFDRNGYKYHGKVKAFADGAREGGLKF